MANNKKNTSLVVATVTETQAVAVFKEWYRRYETEGAIQPKETGPIEEYSAECAKEFMEILGKVKEGAR